MDAKFEEEEDGSENNVVLTDLLNALMNFQFLGSDDYVSNEGYRPKPSELDDATCSKNFVDLVK